MPTPSRLQDEDVRGASRTVLDVSAGLVDILERVQLTIVGHSMRGLVARSACRTADQRGHAWRKHLQRLVFRDTPHQGSPLERGGHQLDYLLDLSPYSAPFTRPGRSRSAGIPGSRQWIGHEIRHLELLHRPEAYAQLRAWLQEPL